MIVHSREIAWAYSARANLDLTFDVGHIRKAGQFESLYYAVVDLTKID